MVFAYFEIGRITIKEQQEGKQRVNSKPQTVSAKFQMPDFQLG